MSLAAAQRAALCGLLDGLSEAQWAAETLCAGWDAGDVAAHLVVREREPLAAAGLLLPPLRKLLSRRTAARKQAGRAALTAWLRAGPPWPLRFGPLGHAQVAEDWIHGQDIRRGGAGVPGDSPSSAVQALLWRAIGRFARGTLARAGLGGVVALSDGERRRTFRIGQRFARPHGGALADVTVRGPVGELLLFVTGRPGAAVRLDGDPLLTAALESAGRSV